MDYGDLKIQAATNRKKILVVDDERSITQMMAMMLETRGYDVDVASCGGEAITKAVSKPDLILLDLILPDLQGFEVCRRLRESKSTRHIPIIIISVKYLFEDKIEGLYLGADDYLTKPFDHEELFARIEAVIRRSLFFDEVSNKKEEVILELRKIVDEKLIFSFYQPIFSLKPFKILGFEALSRPSAKSMLANPELLFKTALRYGLYCDLELLAWEKALQNLPHCYADTDIKLFLNCNPYLIESPKFFKIESLFEKYHFAPSDTILEITERSVISDFATFYQRLRFYQNSGFQICIDDVGSGYASLETIVETKPKVIKIDIHHVRNLTSDPLKQSLIKFIVAFCKENSILAVAEGVEQKEDLETLAHLGVDGVQGYLLCMPLATIDLAEVYKDIHVRLNIDTPAAPIL